MIYLTLTLLCILVNPIRSLQITTPSTAVVVRPFDLTWTRDTSQDPARFSIFSATADQDPLTHWCQDVDTDVETSGTISLVIQQEGLIVLSAVPWGSSQADSDVLATTQIQITPDAPPETGTQTNTGGRNSSTTASISTTASSATKTVTVQHNVMIPHSDNPKADPTLQTPGSHSLTSIQSSTTTATETSSSTASYSSNPTSSSVISTPTTPPSSRGLKPSLIAAISLSVGLVVITIFIILLVYRRRIKKSRFSNYLEPTPALLRASISSYASSSAGCESPSAERRSYLRQRQQELSQRIAELQRALTCSTAEIEELKVELEWYRLQEHTEWALGLVDGPPPSYSSLE